MLFILLDNNYPVEIGLVEKLAGTYAAFAFHFDLVGVYAEFDEELRYNFIVKHESITNNRQ